MRSNIDRGLKLGLKAIKIVADPFWRDGIDKTASLMRAAHEHVGPDIRLMVNAATAWARAEEGLPLMPIFKEHDFFWVEAPLPIDDLDGNARFQGFGMPIGGGDLGLTTSCDASPTWRAAWASGSSLMATSRTSPSPPISPSFRGTGWTSRASTRPASRRCAGT